MQQTTKYKFNLIETSDTFSPDPLNKNTEAVETQLAALEGVDAANRAAREKVIGFGGKATCRNGYGSYVGTGKYGQTYPNSLSFDFKPHVVFIACTKYESSHQQIMLRNGAISLPGGASFVYTTWGERQISWYSPSGSYGPLYQCNAQGVTYYWVALGESAE